MRLHHGKGAPSPVLQLEENATSRTFLESKVAPSAKSSSIYTSDPAATRVGLLPEEASAMPTNVHTRELSSGLIRGSAPREEVGLTDR